MSVFSVVRFRAKPGRNQELISAHRRMRVNLAGLSRAELVQIAERDFILITEWENQQLFAAAQPKMRTALQRFRDSLEELGPTTGVTTAVAGPSIVTIK